ncbi:ATP-dependent nuclease [Massilia timonae]|uniref:ATP-dependent nuclease n=1 Tax=Massilia timonae TaxID=47229 RepID=UPI0028D446C1|nr:AAA family ATPase [Massilia timonae]
MTILIKDLSIINFRSCKNATVTLSAFTPLVGYNNCGKSNMLSAIQWLLRKSSLDGTDFNDTQKSVEVIGTITGITPDVVDTLDPKQRASIQPYIVAGVLKVRRCQLKPNAKATEILLHVWSMGEGEGKWVPNPNGIDNALSALLPDPIRIGAMENSAEDASKAKTTTTIGKLLAEFLNPVRNAHGQELSQHLLEVERRVTADGDLRLGELGNLDDSINSKVNEMFPGLNVKLDFPVPTIDEIIKSGTVRVYEDNGPGRSFSSYGHGAQRSIQIALIRHLADVRRANAINARTTLLLIDEPELYLHPVAIEQVRFALKQLSKTGYQVIFSTHSSQLVGTTDAQHTLLIRKSENLGTYSRQRLADAIQNVVPDSIHQMEQLFTLTNSSKILFSERVVLAEGKTEIRLLPCIFEQLTGASLGQKKIALIAQSGVNDTKKSKSILEAMDMPTKAIADLDYAFNGCITHGFVEPNDTDIKTLKNILAQMAAAGQVTLNPATGTPKNGVIKASEAFTELAKNVDAKPAIKNLHVKLKTVGIWLWTNGAIEQHIGIDGKNETCWAAFQTKAETDGIDSICSDMVGLKELIQWLEE